MTSWQQRWATEADIPAVAALMERAIAELQRGFLTPEQVAASRASMGLDTQLIADRTYLLVERDGVLLGCGGWSRRATLYGGDHSAALRDAAVLDPARDAARIRAMYTAPEAVRQGIGRRVLAACEEAARDAGFRRAELMATMAGVPLYAACGYTPIETVTNTNGPVPVPLVRMGKRLVA